ncbi:MAG: DUF3488 and transglutaminase-like domain-containing protein [Acidimicrobiales bacterium]
MADRSAASTGQGPAPAPLSGRLLAVAEAALVALTISGVIGLARLFSEASFLLPVLGFAVGGHALALGCRRNGLSAPLTAAAAVGGLVVGVSVFLLPETTAFGIPTGATVASAGQEFSAALTTFREVVAPAPVEPGFVLAAAVAVWVVAFISDTAAFRAGATVEAAVPAATVFLFGAALGAPPYRVATTGVFLAALVAYWLAQRGLVYWRLPNRMADDAGSGPGPLLRTGAALGGAAVMAAVVIGPLLPGAEASAVVPWRSGDGDGETSRVTISPLVDIRARILDQADVELFTVASENRSYWRLTSLEIFDGRIWSSRGQYRQVDGRLAGAVSTDQANTTASVQDFEIGPLASIWLPAAYAPVRIDGVEATYDDDSGSLLPKQETASGLRYRVVSELADITGPELAQVPSLAPAEVAETYTALPAGFSEAVGSEAARVVQGSATQYDKARLLQDHFRGGAFSYDLSVPPGHGGDDLERFLFETRRGYCEQFAGAYAAMARAVGLPARVAVGFTPGERQDDGRFSVRGLNAHAWPEVFLAGYGWVAFEPTPGRGMPRAEAYTGVPEQQATPENPNTATTLAPTGVSPPATAPPAAPTTVAPGDRPKGPGPEAPGSPWPGSRLLIALTAVGAPLLWWATLAMVMRRRRARRRSASTSGAERVLVSWAEVEEALARAGAPPQHWETPIEYARRAAAATGVDHRLLSALAGVTTAAGYGPGAIDEAVAEQAAEAAGDLERHLHDGLDNKARLLHALDPRPLLPKRAPRMDIRVGQRRPAVVDQ